ncbi:hypothetical protein HNQ07_000048 [Deinococcus metalli]|uniref:PepSY domain-containing protein n=1 Tax=Deinococcus metalli TaxID=1141878 RepID=A0A7W8KAC9_9DEIO|nr:hypothetical protein [Deinococcus metalli]MBB5374604.1 hypothetical protein [Deinococcus metalli]GHF35084.1 hypothetical protein GCM10017781_09930 [Deinococcus metalli]
MMKTTAARPWTRVSLRLAAALLAGSALLPGPGHAQTPAPDSAVSALLAGAQPGARYTLPGSVDEVCARLAKAGLTLQGLGWTVRGQTMHVYHDAARGQYLSVLDGEHTVVRVSSLSPSGSTWLWGE